MIVQAIHKVINGENLSYDTARTVMEEIMAGEATDSQIASFLTALRMKGETIEEITACASVMREKSVGMIPDFDVMDIVGTGGDESGTFNISTTTAFVVAAAGVPVAKHGNRSVSSKSGAADVLEHLGVNIRLTPLRSHEILEQIGLCFLFAQVYHTSMKHAAPVRKEIGVRTIFNILGPLSNPAGATMQLLGVFDENLVEPLAKVLSNLGVQRGMVIFGYDGLDEITLTDKTKVMEIDKGQLKSYDLAPEDLGFPRCSPEDLKGGDAEENAQITLRILQGEETGPKRDVVVLNAASAIYLAKEHATLMECIHLAQEAIDSGAALQKLEELVRLSNQEVAS